MARGFLGLRRRRSRRRGHSRSSRRRDRRNRRILFVVGVIALSVSLGAALMQTVAHFRSTGLPGCGLESACAEAAAGPWGAIPWIDWPLSFVGAAFFASALLAWVICRGAASAVLRNLVRVGALGSVFLTGVMVFEGYLCLYCLAVHCGNLIFWIISERSPRPSINSRWPAGSAVGVFAVSSAILLLAGWRAESTFDAQAERDLNESSREIVARSRDIARSRSDTVLTDTRLQGALSEPANAAAIDPVDFDARPSGFTGRYRLGPESCAIRVVAFTDFQCPLCAEVEKNLRDIVRQQDDLSLSIKHFPACSDCNSVFGEKNLHPNACRAARVAEAAGILLGDDGFWAMSDWIFDRSGKFDDKALHAALAEMGHEKNEFVRIMDGDSTLRRVQADIEEGITLGLRSTPMLFINGVELRGLRRTESVVRAIKSLRKKQLPAMTAESDHPAAAPEKYLAEWRKAPVKVLPADALSRALGDAAGVRIVMWGDYQGPFTPPIDIAIRNLLEGRTDAQYSFRYFPVNKSCNPVVASVEHLGACLAARSAESAALMGGDDAFWKMHDWLMRNPDRVFDIAIRSAAEEIGLDADELFETMKLATVNSAIEEDARAAVEAGLKRTPWLFVNGKRVPQLLGDADRVLGLIIEDAARSTEESRAVSGGD